MIAITGEHGYIAANLKNFLTDRGYTVRLLSVRGKVPEDIFKGADTVIHAAGIVHNKKADARLYHTVNFELTEKLANYAKNCGVKHFIFISSMSVYGKEEGEINKNTPTLPVIPYGKSKLAAENAVLKLQSEDFKVTVLRPPIVYGKNCPGNYARLSALAKKTPVFPLVENKHSMIFIDNLSNCIKKVIDEGITGVLLPQNSEYVNTTNLCELIAKCHGKKLHCSKLLAVPLRFIRLSVVKKAFGSLYYAKDAAFSNDTVDFETSVRLSETDM